MRLLVDIGNSRFKWAYARQGRLLPGGAEPLPAQGEEAGFLSRIWDGVSAPGRLVVSNVAGDSIQEALGKWSLANWRCEAEFVTSTARQGEVINGYLQPDTLGADRWCALIGARTVARGPLCVVGCGTALTLDLLAADGRHEGGLIAPGLRTMANALGGATRGVRLEGMPVSITAPLGRSTVECVGAGLLAAAAGLVEHTLERVSFSRDGLVLLTGGDAALLGPLLNRSARLEPDLVFLGLAGVSGGLA